MVPVEDVNNIIARFDQECPERILGWKWRGILPARVLQIFDESKQLRIDMEYLPIPLTCILHGTTKCWDEFGTLRVIEEHKWNNMVTARFFDAKGCEIPKA